MKDKSCDLLDLDSLSVRLSSIYYEFENNENIDDIKKLISQILVLLRHRNEYYYQFSHGGSATGFAFYSAELINKSTRLLALIKEDIKKEIILESRNKLMKDIKDIIQMIEGDAGFRIYLIQQVFIFINRLIGWIQVNILYLILIKMKFQDQ